MNTADSESLARRLLADSFKTALGFQDALAEELRVGGERGESVAGRAGELEQRVEVLQ
jgi:hypothetical protein